MKDLTPEELAMQALVKAKDAFQNHISDYYCDPSYFDIDFKAYVLSVEDYKRITKVSLEHEVKE